MGQNSIDSVMSPAQQWIYTTSPATTQYMTFNTPIEAAAANQCGRVTFTDVHVATGDSSHPDIPFPMGCAATTTMTPQELALEFMFFDLSSCVSVQTGTPSAAYPAAGLGADATGRCCSAAASAAPTAAAAPADRHRQAGAVTPGAVSRAVPPLRRPPSGAGPSLSTSGRSCPALRSIEAWHADDGSGDSASSSNPQVPPLWGPRSVSQTPIPQPRPTAGVDVIGAGGLTRGV